MNQSLEPGVRWMALTCAKNGVDQHWRVAAKVYVEIIDDVTIYINAQTKELHGITINTVGHHS